MPDAETAVYGAPVPPPPDRAATRAALRVYGLVDPEREVAFDGLAELAGRLAGTRLAAVTAGGRDGHRVIGAVGTLPDRWDGRGPDGLACVAHHAVQSADGVTLGAVWAFAERWSAAVQPVDLAPVAHQASVLFEARWRRQTARRGLAPPGVVVIDAEGNLRSATPAITALLGWDVAELQGASVLGLVHPEDAALAVEALVMTAAYPGEKVPLDLRIARNDGSWQLVQIVGESCLDDPDVQGIVITVVDAGALGAVDAFVSGEARILERIARGAPVAETLAALAELVEEHADGARCCISTIEGGVLVPVTPPTLPDAFVDALRRSPVGEGEGSCGTAVQRSQAVIVHDVTSHPLWSGARREAALAAGIRAAWSVPILSFEDRRPLGTIAVYDTRVGAPRADLVRLLDLCTHLAAVAVERGRAEARLAHQATHDPLTGLPNRLLFHDRLSTALRRRRVGEATVAVLFLDVDRFKVINDGQGHESGDRLLVAVARRLESLLRPGDTVARFGGDEFTVLCDDVRTPRDAVTVAERIAAGLAAPFAMDEGEVFVTASIGVAVATSHDSPAEALLRDADAAMYRAKERGRNRIEVFDELMRARAVERLTIEKQLHRAVARDELVLHYQPEVAVDDGRLVGAEALVRWEHPEHGLVPPMRFIPVAEECGLIGEIGHWVLTEACRQASRWRDTPAAPPVVWVNISAHQLAEPHLAAEVAAVLRDTGLAAGRLGLEITESVLMRDAEASCVTLEALHDLGVRLAVDDFGTGYSSLGYLKRFPVDVVKVDRSFVAGLGEDGEDSAIVAAVVSMTHALGLQALAEGVETELHLAQLRALGCDFAQGYYFAPPVPAAAVVSGAA